MIGKNGAYCDSRVWLVKRDALVPGSKGYEGCGEGGSVNSGRRAMRLFGVGRAAASVDDSGRPRFAADGRYLSLLYLSISHHLE